MNSIRCSQHLRDSVCVLYVFCMCVFCVSVYVCVCVLCKCIRLCVCLLCKCIYVCVCVFNMCVYTYEFIVLFFQTNLGIENSAERLYELFGKKWYRKFCRTFV
jgi:hypothetical protein